MPLQTLLRLWRCHWSIWSLSSWRRYPITYNSIQEEQRRFERSDIYSYCIYLDLQFAFTSKGSSPLWRFPHHIAQMNVFMPQAVLPQQIPTSQCSATPKKSLSCMLAVALVQVSPRYAVPSGNFRGNTKPGISCYDLSNLILSCGYLIIRTLFPFQRSLITAVRFFHHFLSSSCISAFHVYL